MYFYESCPLILSTKCLSFNCEAVLLLFKIVYSSYLNMFIRYILANTYCLLNLYNKCQFEQFHSETEVFFHQILLCETV